MVRLATVIEITPGGVGVVEVAYIAALTYVAGDGWDAEITAGVLLFRFVTYVAPIPVGAVCYVIWRRMTRWRREPRHGRGGDAARGRLGPRRTSGCPPTPG